MVDGLAEDKSQQLSFLTPLCKHTSRIIAWFRSRDAQRNPHWNVFFSFKNRFVKEIFVWLPSFSIWCYYILMSEMSRSPSLVIGTPSTFIPNLTGRFREMTIRVYQCFSCNRFRNHKVCKTIKHSHGPSGLELTTAVKLADHSVRLYWLVFRWSNPFKTSNKNSCVSWMKVKCLLPFWQDLIATRGKISLNAMSRLKWIIPG